MISAIAPTKESQDVQSENKPSHSNAFRLSQGHHLGLGFRCAIIDWVTETLIIIETAQ